MKAQAHARVVYHAVGADDAVGVDYGRWRELLPPVIDSLLGAAAATARGWCTATIGTRTARSRAFMENLPAAVSGPRSTPHPARRADLAPRAGEVPDGDDEFGRAAREVGGRRRVAPADRDDGAGACGDHAITGDSLVPG
jgi:hypothetical protein